MLWGGNLPFWSSPRMRKCRLHAARGGLTGSQTRCNLKTGTWHHGMADAAWLHSFRVWTSHCLYLYYAYPYLCLYVRGTVHCLLAYCVVNPKNWSLWWKLGGTAVKKPQVWSPLGWYRHVIILFMTFWPCRTSSGFTFVGAHQAFCFTNPTFEAVDSFLSEVVAVKPEV